MAILTSSDKTQFFSEVVATSTTLDGLLIIAQALCESVYGAGRPLDVTEYSDVVKVYSSGLAFIKRSPLIDVSAIVTRSSPQENWTLLSTDDYSIDYDVCQVNIKRLNSNWGYSPRRNSPSQEVRIVYTSGFDFSTDTSQEADNIRAICGRIVSYMEQAVAIGKANITNADGFQSFVTSDNFLGVFLLPLAKYRPRG